MNILILGGGGREHALAWKIAQSKQSRRVFVAPGNAGTAQEPKVENIKLDITAPDAVVAFAQQNAIDLTIVGPEGPLVAGVVDAMHASGLLCFGPRQAAAQLEGSKSFAKDFMARHHIPTATYQSFTQFDEAWTYAQQQPLPLVIKADGLAAGKGVVIARTYAEIEATLQDMLAGNTLGEAGHKVVIEEFLVGEEASFIVMVDGKHILPLASSQDHKTRDDGDQGPNTGGMGAYSPAPVVTPEVAQHIMRDIIEPTVLGMTQEGSPYTGFLYAGVMVQPNGQAKVLEFNCRLGDPETQPLMMRLQSDLIDLCVAACEGRLDQMTAAWDPRPALGVVMAAQGYPYDYAKGCIIEGLETGETDVKVFHAGTADRSGQTVTAGGRVLCVTALGKHVIDAKTRAYARVTNIHWDGAFYRRDIGDKAIFR